MLLDVNKREQEPNKAKDQHKIEEEGPEPVGRVFASHDSQRIPNQRLAGCIKELHLLNFLFSIVDNATAVNRTVGCKSNAEEGHKAR